MNADFLLTSLLIVISPGTGALITLSTGLQQGARRALVAAVGCTLGVVPHMLAALTGLAALLQANPLAFGFVKYIGVAYLLFMGWQTLRDSGPMSITQSSMQPSQGALVRYAILANALNPKLSVFFLAFLPQFVTTGDPHPVRTMLLLSTLFSMMTLAIFAFYGAFAARVRHLILGNVRVMNGIRWSVSVAFIVLAVKLALSHQS
ncbi:MULTISPECIES: LysE family translocator [unclassified Serratia (in: enterobacteria)]|uniref:LysE family translocator n=1 Tax=unclassified Serratia (in: enterobacteria) TaxID=2647522 RepID=UPI0027E69703|nr:MULTISPECIES: LysE family translocator [unclassified Serratia (in: enterobacteria)]MDQ7101009.1 LysE family translocator [Serratia sp. MF2]MDQ7102584.1 LysE family translocator [Serratia sp. MF1(2023)]